VSSTSLIALRTSTGTIVTLNELGDGVNAYSVQIRFRSADFVGSRLFIIELSSSASRA
jgi:hypothetical protein